MERAWGPGPNPYPDSKPIPISKSRYTSSWGSPNPIQEIAATKTKDNKKWNKGGKQSFDDILAAVGVRPN